MHELTLLLLNTARRAVLLRNLKILVFVSDSAKVGLKNSLGSWSVVMLNQHESSLFSLKVFRTLFWILSLLRHKTNGSSQFLQKSVSNVFSAISTTRISSGIWSRLYGWLLWMCVPRIGSFPSALNTWSNVWPWIIMWAYLIWNFAHIFGQQISILDPPYIGLFGPSWSELSPYGWIWGGGSIGPRTFFVTDRNVTT